MSSRRCHTRPLARLVAATLLFAVLAPLCLAQPAGFTPTKEPVLDGHRATADLPASQHHRNVGGIDGAGLCVYTSTWHAAIWQDCRDLYEFRAYMQKRPGGSYPEKFDATIKAYCKAKGIPVPGYVQHTGGDEEFLKLALKTGRMVCVTYCGVDGKDSYGNEVIAHMVNLVYLDDKYAAILDNNFPGRWLWMSRADFLARWRGVKSDGKPFLARDMFGRGIPIGGGWAIVLLDAPPAPYPASPTAADSKPLCCCGDGCKCEPGDCPKKCPVTAENLPAGLGLLIGQYCPSCPSCPDGRCPLVGPPAPFVLPNPAPVIDSEGKWLPNTNGHEWGFWQNGKCLAAAFDDGRVEAVNEYGIATGVAIEPPAPLPARVAAARKAYPAGGVDHTQLTTKESYSISGKPATKQEAHNAIKAPSLTDDSGRWNLTAVGDATFLTRFHEDVAALPAEVRAKLHVHAYGVDEWAVKQFKLSPGVTLRKPAVGRVASDVGALAWKDYSAAKLGGLLGAEGGPTHTPAAPQPKPKDPSPSTPDAEPAPAPKDEPKPKDSATPKNQAAPLPVSQGLGDFLAFAISAASLTLTILARRT